MRDSIKGDIMRGMEGGVEGWEGCNEGVCRLCRPGIGLPVLRLRDVEEGMIFMTGCIYMRGCERACMESGRGDTTKKMQKK